MSKWRSSTFFWAPSMRRVDHPAFDRFAFLHAQPGEHVLHPFAGEDPHQVVFERQVEAAGAGIALPAATTAKLQVDAAGLVPLGADDVQAAGSATSPAFVDHPLLFADLRRQLVPNRLWARRGASRI